MSIGDCFSVAAYEMSLFWEIVPHFRNQKQEILKINSREIQFTNVLQW
jgi:hypothetical protein